VRINEEFMMSMGQRYGRWQRPVVVGLFLVLAAQGLAAENAVSEARMRKDIFFLASDECQGRGVTTKGINRAADYIANEFKKAGLKPAGENGTYFQPFTISGIGQLGSPNTVVLHGPQGQTVELTLDQHFSPLGMSGSGKVNAPVVFVGYGATTSDGSYDDYKDVDVAGKIVVILRKVPRAHNRQAPFDGTKGMAHAPLRVKLDQAKTHQAAAVWFLNHASDTAGGDDLMPFDYTIYEASSSLPVLQLRRSVVDEMIQSSLGTRLRDLEADIDRDLKPRSAELAGWTAQLQVTVKRENLPVKNVVGVLEGTGPKANETVVVGAHYDHLGYGGMGSLAQLKKPEIHHGADDNGSGTTSIMELARRFGQMPTRDRRLVFIAFSGEESGLLGSRHYCNHPIFPLADTVAMVNLDMVGRLRSDPETKKDKLIVYGTGSAKTFDGLIEGLNKKYDFQLKKVPSGMGPSDQMSFYLKKIPVFFLFTDLHPDYHRPSDTADKINVPGMRRVVDLTEEMVVQLLQAPERPEYVKSSEGGTPSGAQRMEGPRLGIQPTYGDDKEGVLLEDVSEGGAAAKAGLKAGDRIVELGGKPVKNLEGYMALMKGRKKGEAIEVGVLRDGKKMTIKVTP
jgi:hypothetical protein